MTGMTKRDGPDAPTPAPETPPAPGAPRVDDAERHLAEAAARSPQLAAMLATGRIGRRRRRPARAALLVAGVLLGAIAAAIAGSRSGRRARELPTAASAPAPAETPSPPGTLIPPLETARDAATGEVIAPFSGFALSVETEPPGAVVAIDGVLRGESPVFTGVECIPGASIRVRAEKPGLAPKESRTACRADTLVKLTIRLGR
jgi:hypothetical protein